MTRIYFLLIPVVVIILDLWTKALVLQRLALHEAIPVIPKFFQIVHVRNTGAAFGLGANASSKLVPILLNVGAIAVFCMVVVYAFRTAVTERVLQTGLHLILGGAVGNLLDRAFRDGDGFLGGGVVDFIDVQWYPIFNVADMGVVLGALLLLFATARYGDGDEAEGGADAETTDDGAELSADQPADQPADGA